MLFFLVSDVGYQAVELNNFSADILEELDILWVERPFYGYNQSNNRSNLYLSNVSELLIAC